MKPEAHVIKVVHIRSRSDKETVYTVEVWDDDVVTCDCMGYQIRRRCTHATYVLEKYVRKIYD